MMHGRQFKMWRIPGSAIWLGVAILLMAGAAAPGVRADDQAPAARAIRLSFVEGKVSLQKNGQELAAQATANTPLFEGTEIKTAEDGKAEIQFEEGSVARLAPNTTVTLSTLSGAGPSGDAEITVDSGLAYFELQQTDQSGTMRIHFGDAQVTASGFTMLRVNLDTPPGTLAVLSGNARVERGDAKSDLHGGESIGLDASNAVSESIDVDSWDSWNSDRDQALNNEASQETGAQSEINGGSSNPAWSDLDANGNWYNVPGQGYMWSPYDASNPTFDPYGYGNWMWTPGYGYIWVSGYGWGYLPFQCGMWNFYGGFGWGWAPGIGGCSPWWGGVGFYPGPVFGVVPVGYRPIRRPPIPVHGPPRARMIPLNRTPVAYAPSLPARNRTTPVQIAGNTVQPLPMRASRPTYVRPTGGIQPPTITRPGYMTAPQSNQIPARPEIAPGLAPAPPAPTPRSNSMPANRGASTSGSSGVRSSGASSGGSHSSIGGSHGGGGSHGK